MAIAYPCPVVSIVVDPAGTPETMVAELIHFKNTIGAKASKLVFRVADRRPKDVTNSSYRGKTCTFKINGTAKMTGTIQRIQKEWATQSVIFTGLDKRHQINADYVGSTFLETLDSNGVQTGTWNGLPYYGADITFNLNGRPNRNLDTAINEFVPPGYEHNTANAAYWTYGQALEWLWTYCVTAVTIPTISGDTPKDWTWGGWNKKMEELSLFGVNVGDAIDAIMARTRSHWWLDASGTAIVASIDSPAASQALVIPDPDSPIAPLGTATDRPIDISVEESTDDAITTFDVIGGKQQREVLLKTVYTGSIYTADEVLVSTDFEQTQWFAISNNPGWLSALDYPGSPFSAAWSNYNVQRYLHIYDGFGSPTNEYVYRYNLKTDIYEAHKIGVNLTANCQPYKMLPQLLAARSKVGAYVNPDEETAIDGVSPLEMLALQYPDGATIDFDRGFLLGRGVEPLAVDAGYTIEPPYWGTSFPNNFTIAFECAYRNYKRVTSAISGVPTVRRCVLRPELIHKTRESTKMVSPVVAGIDAVGNVTYTDGIATPTGWTKDYANGTTPVMPRTLTYTTPAGIIVDGMAELAEISALITPYVGLININGEGAFPTWNDLAIGTLISDASGQYGLTGSEIVTAITFDGRSQRTEFQFTNRLGRDAMALANAFVDQRAYRTGI